MTVADGFGRIGFVGGGNSGVFGKFPGVVISLTASERTSNTFQEMNSCETQKSDSPKVIASAICSMYFMGTGARQPGELPYCRKGYSRDSSVRMGSEGE